MGNKIKNSNLKIPAPKERGSPSKTGRPAPLERSSPSPTFGTKVGLGGKSQIKSKFSIRYSLES